MDGLTLAEHRLKEIYEVIQITDPLILEEIRIRVNSPQYRLLCSFTCSDEADLTARQVRFLKKKQQMEEQERKTSGEITLEGLRKEVKNLIERYGIMWLRGHLGPKPKANHFTF